VSKSVVLSEALIGAPTFWTAGTRNVTAGYRVNGFASEHRLNCRLLQIIPLLFTKPS